MEQPFLNQWKQAQVSKVNTFFTEPTAWKPQTHVNVRGPNMAWEPSRPAQKLPRDQGL